MAPTTPKPLSASEVLDSLTGYDEDAITKVFGAPVTDLDGTKFLRALLFGNERHSGKSDEDAMKAVQSLTISKLKDRFVPEDDEDPELPGSEAGKDDE